MLNQIFVISGAGGMTGLELVKQIAESNPTASFILFDNGFNCDLRKLHNLCMHIKNPKDTYLGTAYSIENESFLRNELMASINLHIDSFGGDPTELIFVNCAAVVHTKWFYEPSAAFGPNVLGMKMFLNLLLTYKNVDNLELKFINCSTSEVYSMQSYRRGGVMEDDYLLMATSEHSLRTSYAMGKLMTEMFTKEAHDKYNLKCCSIRFANVYTEDELLPEHIIPYAIDQLTKDDHTVHLLENARFTKRTFLHNHDSASAVLELANTDSALDGTAYNVGTIDEYEIAEVVDMIAKNLGYNPEDYKIVYDKPARKSDPERRLLNCLKIQIRTRWIPIITLEKGLKRCVEAVMNKSNQ